MMSASANLGHGMGELPEEKDWRDISLADLKQLQPFYPQLQGAVTILWRSPRPFSSAVLLQAGQNTYFIKRSHASFRSALDLQQEHLFIQHLAHQALPVPKVLCAAGGVSAVELEGWSYEVHEKAAGLDLYADHLSWKPFFCTEHAAQAGQMLANLHLAAQSYSIKQARHAKYLVSNQDLLLSADIVGAIHQRINSSPALCGYFADKTLDPLWLAQLHKAHQGIKTAMQRAAKIWTHNDLHASNLLWAENSAQTEISAVIDFGLADYNSAIYDLAVAIERNFFDWLALDHSADIHIDLTGLEAFLQAYAANAASSTELEILPELIKIVHTDFAFSELEYFVGITCNKQHADAAYYGWLIAHTNWFNLPQGQAFCQHLAKLIEQIKR